MQKAYFKKNSIILASSSKQRKKSLKNLGLSFKVCPPFIHEEEKKKELSQRLKNKDSFFHKLCQSLAYEKAKSLKPQFSNSIIIGGDQMIKFKNRSLGKPLNKEKAKYQLKLLSNQTHELITSVCILYGKKKFFHTESAFLSMQKLSTKEIESYIQRDQPFNSCGSYQLEKSGLLLFKKIKCSDFSSLFGLPVLAVIKTLRKLNAISI